MVKTMLSTIPIYYLSVYKFSNSTLNGLDRIFKKILWEGSKEEKKTPLISWDTTFLAKEDGGASLRQMSFHNKALGAKLAWKIYSTLEKPWCRIMVAKYLDSWSLERILIVANSPSGSQFWQHIWASRKLITEHITWRIGDGHKEKFWRDSWNGEPPLESFFIEKDWVHHIKSVVGMWVSDYMQHDNSCLTQVKWRSFNTKSLENRVVLQKILTNRIILHSSAEDTIIWSASKSGSYKVQLGFELQRRRLSNSQWPSKICWGKGPLPKDGSFLWVALHGRILIGNRLKTISIAGPHWCILCKQSDETFDHLLLWCPFASTCWE